MGHFLENERKVLDSAGDEVYNCARTFVTNNLNRYLEDAHRDMANAEEEAQRYIEDLDLSRKHQEALRTREVKLLERHLERELQALEQYYNFKVMEIQNDLANCAFAHEGSRSTTQSTPPRFEDKGLGKASHFQALPYLGIDHWSLKEERSSFKQLRETPTFIANFRPPRRLYDHDRGDPSRSERAAPNGIGIAGSLYATKQETRPLSRWSHLNYARDALAILRPKDAPVAEFKPAAAAPLSGDMGLLIRMYQTKSVKAGNGKHSSVYGRNKPCQECRFANHTRTCECRSSYSLPPIAAPLRPGQLLEDSDDDSHDG
eukprot:jgi/Botrbrau1/8012/Bobra.384_2s0034.1